MPSDKQPPKPAPVQEKKTVWMSCRATHGCEGKQATLVWKNRSEGGGWNARYRCQTCGGSFHINT